MYFEVAAPGQFVSKSGLAISVTCKLNFPSSRRSSAVSFSLRLIMFLFHMPRSSTYPRPNSLDAISSAWPRSWLISSVITESLKWLLIAAKGAAPEPEPHNSEDAAAPPRAVRKLRRDGNTSMQYPLPRHGRSRCADGSTSLCRGHLSLAFSWKASALFPSTPSSAHNPLQGPIESDPTQRTSETPGANSYGLPLWQGGSILDTPGGCLLGRGT